MSWRETPEVWLLSVIYDYVIERSQVGGVIAHVKVLTSSSVDESNSTPDGVRLPSTARKFNASTTCNNLVLEVHRQYQSSQIK